MDADLWNTGFPDVDQRSLSCMTLLRGRPREVRGGVFMGILGAIALVLGVYMLQLSNRPPVTVLSSNIVNTSVQSGDWVTLYVKLNSLVDRSCPGGIVREYTSVDKTEIIDGREVPIVYRDGGDQPILQKDRYEYVVRFPAAVGIKPLPPDVYDFVGETTYFCTGLFGRSTRYRGLPQRITITAAP